MGIGDKIVKWWVQNFYATKMIKYEPGFIVTEFKNQYGDAYQRLITLPEKFCIDFENNLKGDDTKKSILRKIGIELGFNHGFTIGAPQINRSSHDLLKKYLQFSINYASMGWAKSSKLESLDLENNELIITYDKHVVCRNNGCGILFKESLIEGFLDYSLNKNFFTKDSKCQGRGDELCRLHILSDDSELPSLLYTKNDKAKYRTINKVQPLAFSKKSASAFFDAGLMKTDDGLFFINNQCVFNSSILLLYLIEKHIGNDNPDLVFNPAFECGKVLIKPKNLQDLTDLFSVFGYGELLIKKRGESFECTINAAPWEPLYDKVKSLNYFAGLLSGMLSTFTSRDIKLKNCEMILTKDYHFSIRFT